MTTSTARTSGLAPARFLDAGRLRRAWTRAAVLFALLLAAGLVLAAGVAPTLDGVDAAIVIGVGSGLAGAATSFFLVVGFALDLLDGRP